MKVTIQNDRIKLSVWLKKNYPGLDRSHMQKLCRIGEIRIAGRRCTPAAALVAGDELKLPPYIVEYKTATVHLPKVAKEDIELVRSLVLRETSEYIAINKPSGIASQGGNKQKRHMDVIANAAWPEYEGNLRLVHRLDLETSGVLLLAKGYDAARRLSDLFTSREVEKAYVALLYGSLHEKEGEVNGPVLEDDKPKSARTYYKVLDESLNLASLVRFVPETGRKHQLRLHARSLGHPMIGDVKYSPRRQAAAFEAALGTPVPDTLMLHAFSLTLPNERPIIAPPPLHFANLAGELDFSLKGLK
jgi:23S rRNA pseudouridine955/2504/2580 synthase